MFKIFKNRCYNGGKKHKYKPVFDEVHNPLSEGGFTYKGLGDLRSLLVLDRYLKHVCEWCGRGVTDEEHNPLLY